MVFAGLGAALFRLVAHALRFLDNPFYHLLGYAGAAVERQRNGRGRHTDTRGNIFDLNPLLVQDAPCLLF